MFNSTESPQGIETDDDGLVDLGLEFQQHRKPAGHRNNAAKMLARSLALFNSTESPQGIETMSSSSPTKMWMFNSTESPQGIETSKFQSKFAGKIVRTSSTAPKARRA